MRILFLCNKSPWPPGEGGPMAMNMFIEGLLAEGHQVKVLAVNSHKYNIPERDIPEDYRLATGIELVDVDLRIKPLDAFLNLFTRKSYHVQRFESEPFKKRLVATLTGADYDIVQLETLYMCPYIKTIREHSRAKIILRAHNIEHLIWERIARDTKNPLKKWYIGHLARTLKRYEQEAVLLTDAILAITPNDAEYFTHLHPQIPKSPHPHIPKSSNPQIPVVVIPFGLDPKKYLNDPAEAEFPSLFSLGSMNWIPNQEGIRWFLREVWPMVHKQFPELKYYLAGRGMPGWMLSLKIPNVVVLGEVEDAAEFLASKAVMIVPLFSGSGIRIKIIEGMAAGKPVISTAIGTEGIRCTSGEELLIADTPCEFFEAIAITVTDEALCRRIGEKAQTLVHREYHRENLVRKLVEFYQQLAG